MRDQEAAYLAGFLDGEGAFQIRRAKDKGSKNKYRLFACIRVSSTSKAALENLKKNYGGSVADHKFKNPSPNWKPAYRWQIASAMAMKLVHAVYPYLIIKKPQAKLLLKLEATMTHSTKAITHKTMQRRWALKAKINKLNYRGVNPITNPYERLTR